MSVLPGPAADDPRPAADSQIRVQVLDRVGRAEADEALSVAQDAAAADGVAPLSEDARLRLRHGGGPSCLAVLLRRDGADPGPPRPAAPGARQAGSRLAAFACLGPPGESGARSGELVVHPACRRQGLGLLLARTVVARAGGNAVRIWAHGNLPAAAALAAAAGFTRARGLLQMRRPLGQPVGEPAFPPGVTVRAFVPGQDEDAWLALNALAFAAHPEQGRWTREDLERREREPWFDPAGFFLAERDGRLAGFHWTKVHAFGGTLLGEVYVIATHPSMRGAGLGAALTLAGLRHLRGRGAREAMLYVDESNAPAVRLYESLGFTRSGADVMYQHGPTGG